MTTQNVPTRADLKLELAALENRVTLLDSIVDILVIAALAITLALVAVEVLSALRGERARDADQVRNQRVRQAVTSGSAVDMARAGLRVLAVYSAAPVRRASFEAAFYEFPEFVSPAPNLLIDQKSGGLIHFAHSDSDSEVMGHEYHVCVNRHYASDVMLSRVRLRIPEEGGNKLLD